MFTIGAKATIFNDDGDVLLCHSRDYDLWTLPGGVVGDEETPWEAIAREVKKETGLKIKIKRLAGVYTKEHEKDIVFNFECKLEGGEINPAGKSDKIEYFHVNHLPSNTVSRQMERISDVINSDKLIVMKNQTGKSADDIFKAGMENIDSGSKLKDFFSNKSESTVSDNRLEAVKKYVQEPAEKNLQIVDNEMNRIIKSKHFVLGKALDLLKSLIVILAPLYIISFAISSDVVSNISDIQSMLIRSILILLLFWVIVWRFASFDSEKMNNILKERFELINVIRKIRSDFLDELQVKDEFFYKKDKNSDKQK